MKPRALQIVAAALGLGAIFTWLFFAKAPGISVFIYSAVILGLTFYLTRVFRDAVNQAVLWLGPAILFFALMVFVRANELLAFFNICAIIYLLIMVAKLSRTSKANLLDYELPDYLSRAFGAPFKMLGEILPTLRQAVAVRPADAKRKSYAPVIRGILLALPVLFVFMMLLSSADMVFNDLVRSVFDFNFSDELIGRLVLTGFIGSLFTGAYAYIFMPSASDPAKSTDKKLTLGHIESSIVLGSVGMLFLVFLAVQATYLFGGTNQITSTGLTYAEYARKGFFELIAVAAISLGLILGVKRTTKLSSAGHAGLFKLLSVGLIIEVLVIMFSAHLRLDMYESVYGFTTLRLFSHMFIVWLAVAFILLVVNIIRRGGEKTFAFGLFFSALLYLAAINLINPDAFIARRNFDRFNRTGKLDALYLTTLSNDAAPVFSDQLSHSDGDIRKTAAQLLYRQKTATYRSEKHWQSLNLSRERAENIWLGRADQIDDADHSAQLPVFD